MTPDPFHSDVPAAALESEHDREARVEELLLHGLDHYFAAQYELAINVWTRALFLDRGHARARAYIERARGALAERQREGEELIHTGAAAFQRGDADTARRLLTSAVAHGAVTEEALALLERLDRLAAAAVPQDARRQLPRALPTAQAAPRPRGRDRAWLGWVAAGILLGVAAAAIGLMWLRGEPWVSREPGGPVESAARPREEPLPVPTTSEVSLARAHAQYERGRLHEALQALEPIGPGDPLGGDASRLKTAIQLKLLEAGRASDNPPRNRDTPRP